jgi:hypothetical protein
VTPAPIKAFPKGCPLPTSQFTQDLSSGRASYPFIRMGVHHCNQDHWWGSYPHANRAPPQGLPSPCTAVFNLLTQKLHRLLGYDSWGRHSRSRQRMLPLDLPLAIHNSATSNCGLWWPRNPLNRPAENRVDKRLLPPVLLTTLGAGPLEPCLVIGSGRPAANQHSAVDPCHRWGRPSFRPGQPPINSGPKPAGSQSHSTTHRRSHRGFRDF